MGHWALKLIVDVGIGPKDQAEDEISFGYNGMGR